MFETSKPIPSIFCGDSVEAPQWAAPGEPRDSGACAESGQSGDALRAIAWSELTARLNAARDLRRELRQEAILCVGASGAAFGDAAADFFKTFGDGERPVNPEALEACKASGGIPSKATRDAARGDARDKL